MSSVAKNKEELVDAIKSTYEKLRMEFDNIPENLVDEQSMEGQVKNTKMSVNNLLSYLVGWGELVLKWDNYYQKENKLPDLPDTGFKMNEMGKLAQKFYKDYEKENFKTLLKKYDDVVAKILKMIESKDNKELYETDWYKKYPFGRMVAFNTSSPYKNARGRIRKWKNEKELK
jgi:hypothetical protein